ncbi:iron-containing alcohol dehydrogenase family protein [Clostridium sp.]|uniref:iron-containing alcohol dehydrogenase family protein n=1 Tax=Clostridium sp. TaxID=1506 RepID=UPI003463E5F0
MENFKYFMPTKCYVGQNCIKNNGEEIKSIGKKALIVTGRRSSKENGSLDDIVDTLNTLEIDYVIFDEVEENPSLETVDKASNLGKEENVDFVIGVGGGSPIDASKAIAVLIKNKDYNAFNFIGVEPLEGVPVIAVATTAGTGTEVTQYAIVTDHKEKTKKNIGHSVFPKLAFLDSKYMDNMSYKNTVSTALDAFSHLAEAYLNSNANILSDLYCEKGIEIFGECISNLLNKTLDNNLREKLMMVSTLGGMAIAQVGTSLPHGMGYALTYNKGLSHGIANTILYKEYLKSFNNKERVEKIISLMNLKSLDEFGEALDKLIDVEIKITEDEIKAYAKDMAKNAGKLKNHPENIDEEGLFNIYKKSLIK